MSRQELVEGENVFSTTSNIENRTFSHLWSQSREAQTTQFCSAHRTTLVLQRIARWQSDLQKIAVPVRMLGTFELQTICLDHGLRIIWQLYAVLAHGRHDDVAAVQCLLNIFISGTFDHSQSVLVLARDSSRSSCTGQSCFTKPAPLELVTGRDRTVDNPQTTVRAVERRAYGIVKT